MKRWQPIETAPKNQTVLVKLAGPTERSYKECFAYWDEGGLWAEHGFDSVDGKRGWWAYREGKPEKLQPTHWGAHDGQLSRNA